VCCVVTEAVYRVCHQREAGVPLRTKEQELHQVPHLENGGVHYIRVSHHGANRPQHAASDDEGRYTLHSCLF